MSKTETQSDALTAERRLFITAVANLELRKKFGNEGFRLDLEMDELEALIEMAERVSRLDAENKALRARLDAPAAPLVDEREAFEEWARSQPMILDLTPRGDGYAGAFAQTTWMGWKARGAALAPQAADKTGDAA